MNISQNLKSPFTHNAYSGPYFDQKKRLPSNVITEFTDRNKYYLTNYKQNYFLKTSNSQNFQNYCILGSPIGKHTQSPENYVVS